MMEFLDVVKSRRSVRGYAGEPVSRQIIEQLLATAVLAPTGMNLQPWAFGVIEGKETLREYSARAKAFLLAHMHEYPMFERYREMLENPDVNLCHNAPAMVIVYAKPGGATPDNDCSMAAHTIMLTARDLGLGSCWIGLLYFVLNQPEVKRALGVPEEYRVIAPLVIGYPVTEPAPVERNAPEVLFWQA